MNNASATVVGFAARANVRSEAMVMAMKGDCQAAINQFVRSFTPTTLTNYTFVRFAIWSGRWVCKGFGPDVVTSPRVRRKTAPHQSVLFADAFLNCLINQLLNPRRPSLVNVFSFVGFNVFLWHSRWSVLRIRLDNVNAKSFRGAAGRVSCYGICDNFAAVLFQRRFWRIAENRSAICDNCAAVHLHQWFLTD